jgi:uracil-DNA glycosylase family 4
MVRERRPRAAGAAAAALAHVRDEVVRCRRCPRLVEYREEVGRTKRAAYREQEYWARPVPGFGDPGARLLLVGLAPAAHGGNRTGRIFTGDRSGDWLFGALHRAGFANQPRSVSRDDGLRLRGAYVAAAARCAPPANKPEPEELLACRGYLVAETATLRAANASAASPLVVVALGAIAFASVLAVFAALGTAVPRPRPRFAHLAEHRLAADAVVLCSYHPSQQNTQTGVLTQPMFDAVFARARELLGG